MSSLDLTSSFNSRDPVEARFHPLDAGRVVSMTYNLSGPLAAIVAKLGPELLVQLARPDQTLPFKEGDQILTKHWDEDQTSYYWQTDVAKISNQGYLTLTTPGQGMTVHQRAFPRVSAAIPLSFTIIDAADSQLNGEKIPKIMSQDISMGGVFFEQGLLLTVGDKLETQFHMPFSKPVHAIGLVVRCEPISVDKRPLHSVAVEFLQIDEDDQFRLLESVVPLQEVHQ